METYCSEFRIPSGTNWTFILMDDMRTIVPKNVFLLITWERVFFFKYGTKWSFSVKVEPIVPSSESRAEQIAPLSVI